jgi:FHA domain
VTASFDDVRGEVLSGSHLVLRVPGIVALIRRDEGAGQAASADLLSLIRDAARESGATPGRELALRLTRWVVVTGAVPGFGTVSATEDGIAVFLHGDVSLSELPGSAADDHHEPLHLSGRTAAFTVDRLLPWPAGPIALAAGAAPEPEGPTAIGVLGWSGLVQGLVPGDGIVLGSRASAAPAPGGRHQAGAPAEGAAQESEPRSDEFDAGATQAHPDARPSADTGPVTPLPDASVVPGAPALVPPAPPAPRPPEWHPPALHPPARNPLDPGPLFPPRTPIPPAAGAPPAAGPPAAGPPVPHPPDPGPPLPVPPGAAPPKLRSPRLSEQIHRSHRHEARRPPLPLAGAKVAAPRPGARDQPSHVVVKGFRCSRNHLNDPRVSFCSVCGIRMDQRTGILIDGRRPPLGLLVLDIGATFVLDDNYLLGRNPETDEAVVSGRLRPIRLDDDSGTLSRVHAEIRLQGWDVVLIDRGSANGTYVAAANQPGWTRLAPPEAFVLAPGTHVRTGRRMFTFESAHARL